MKKAAGSSRNGRECSAVAPESTTLPLQSGVYRRGYHACGWVGGLRKQDSCSQMVYKSQRVIDDDDDKETWKSSRAEMHGSDGHSGKKIDCQ